MPSCGCAAPRPAPRREAGAEAEIAVLTAAILDGDALDVIRACSMELHLANLAETRERVRRRYGYERAGGPPQRESIAEAADRLAPGAAAATLDHLRLDLTFTAHPTEATRWSVMQHAGDVSAAMARLDDERLGRTARERIVGGIRESLALWWQTADVRRERPQVDDEVRRNLPFFDRVLFDAVPELVRELERWFGERPLDFAPGPLLELGRRGHGRPPGRDGGHLYRHDRPAPPGGDAAAARPGGAARVPLQPARGGAGSRARRARGEHAPRRRADARGGAPGSATAAATSRCARSSTTSPSGCWSAARRPTARSPTAPPSSCCGTSAVRDASAAPRSPTVR